jgi:dihydrofolate reductase
MEIGFKGYAVVSADGFIADDRGRMPDTLRFEADWAYFQTALDAVDVTLLGRHTHEAAPNVKRRRRLVVSRGVCAVIQENAWTWWANPREVTPESAIAAVSPSAVTVAVVGGTGVFGWVLQEGGYREFHLSVAHHVRLGAGRPLFDDAGDLDVAIAKLEGGDLSVRQRSWLDQEAGLELLVFQHRAA